MQQPKTVSTGQDRVGNPAKQLFTDYQPLGGKSDDKSQLIDEGGSGNVGTKINKSYVPAVAKGIGQVARGKILQGAESCPCCRCSKRWQVAILANIGFIIVFGIRCNFGAARERMTTNFTDPYGVVHDAEVQWTPSVLGVIEGSFFYGYLITQVPGGFIAARFPANKLFGLAIGLTSLFNLFMPGASHAGYGLAVFVQILQGLAQGVAYPAMHGIWRYWAPPLERTKLATTAFTGSYAGAVIGLPLSALMTSYVSWQSSYYFYGVAGCVWFVFWWAITFEKPSHHPTITDEECVLIENSIGPTSHTVPKVSTVPWKAIFASKCVWAIIVANFCRSWTFYLLLNHQLAFMEEVLHMRMQNSGLWAAMPHAVMSVVVLLGGQLADYLRSRNILSTTSVRKLFNCGGFGMEAIFLIVCAYTRKPAGAVAALIFAVGFSGFAISGFNVNHLDIAPRYASILMGLSNGVGTFSGMICPAITERLTKKYGETGWETVFLLAGLIHLTGVTFYAFFASGEKQPWAEPPSEEETWRPDDFAGKAAVAGMYTQYGAAEPIQIQPLPSTEELMSRKRKVSGVVGTSDGNQPQNIDPWAVDYPAPADSYQQNTSSNTGIRNQNFYGY